MRIKKMVSNRIRDTVRDAGDEEGWSMEDLEMKSFLIYWRYV